MNTPIVIDHLSGFQVSGPDAQLHLHSQLTHDLLQQTADAWQISAWCEPRGRCLYVVLVAKASDASYLAIIAPQAQIEGLKQRLQRFSIGRKVVFGPTQAVAWAEDGWPLLQDPKRRLRLLAADEAFITDQAQTRRWRLADLSLPLPWLDDLSSGQHLPHSLGLLAHDAISTNKGCYPGQEVIARLHFRGGQVKRWLMRIEHLAASDDLRAGAVLLDAEGAPVADLLSAEPPLALAVSRYRIDAPSPVFLGEQALTLHPIPDTISP